LIKHARRVLGPHSHYQGFGDFGDAEQYRERLKQVEDGVKGGSIVSGRYPRTGLV